MILQFAIQNPSLVKQELSIAKDSFTKNFYNY